MPRSTGRKQIESEEKECKREGFDYENDLEIDLVRLDFEFATHAQTFMKYAKEAASANKRAKLADERVKTMRSQLIKEANENPEVMGKGIKPTAPNVEAYYRDHSDYKEVKKASIEAEYYSDLMTNVIFAFQARKSALENEVRLRGQEYNGEPQEPRDIGPEAIEQWKVDKSKSVQDRIKDKMKRR